MRQIMLCHLFSSAKMGSENMVLVRRLQIGANDLTVHCTPPLHSTAAQHHCRALYYCSIPIILLDALILLPWELRSTDKTKNIAIYRLHQLRAWFIKKHFFSL